MSSKLKIIIGSISFIIILLIMFPTIKRFIEIDNNGNWDDEYVKCDTILINQETLIGCHNSQTNYYVINEKKDTVYQHDEWVYSAKFIDFNNDGYDDILFGYMSNTPEAFDLALYNPNDKNFKLVKDFPKFPSPTEIDKTGIYYSYHKSGCADWDWDSDLFILKDFEVVKLGNIHGIGCETSNKNTGIFISKVKGTHYQLIDSILREPGYYDEKFGFIKSYWNSNHKKFE
ncbi:hypothetical protein MY04_4492 [Flammeovirga sp. MY04]|uniref:XAC2610-related protein n=1 Tax=Flammeovirga sp. MY04 TaxID=1191459 RepID=UPI0008061F91|nr:hypothetical protein [Flammeovirga sp. MY04]ANQ51827.1 hypothetical protein MY04_4492 [Flammeovirga sp. MY04]